MAAHALGWVILVLITLVCSPLAALAAMTVHDPILERALSDVSQLLTSLCILALLIIGVGGAVMLALIERLEAHEKNLASLAGISTPASGNGNESKAMVTIVGGIKPQRQFRMVLAKGLLPVIHQYVADFLRAHGKDQEAGGMLAGEYLLDEASGTVTFQIQGFIEAGPEVEFSAGSILFDARHQAQALRGFQLEHPRAINLGCIHRHPGSLDVCSGGDAVTDREAVENSDTKALVFAIITLNNPRQGPSSLFYLDFKLDFYLMAEETSFAYVPIQPVLADLPVLKVSQVMNALLALRGPNVLYDLAVLRQLPGLEKSALCTVEAGAESGLCLNVSFKDAPETLHVWIVPDGATWLVLRDAHGIKSIFPGPWEQPETGGHVWLSHLIMLARRQLVEFQPSAGYGTHFSGLLHDKHRLVAEVRAMQERYGNRAVLRRRGDSLHWAYTVRESGRSFPIEIQYPDTYPNDPPQIVSVESLPSSPHQLGRNRLCWTNTYSSNSEWNPSRDTAVICIHAAHGWFACLLIYLTNGNWPAGAND